MDKKFTDNLIARAVKREEEAYRLYTNAAGKVKRKEVAGLFTELAAQELEHKKILLNLDITKLANSLPSKISDTNISYLSDVEPLSEDSTLQDALLYAINREDDSYKFYKELSELACDAGLKNIFENLATFEMRHKNCLQEMYESKIYQEN